MRAIRWLGTTALTAALACGCSSMNNTEKGAVAGGALGAGAGAIIGHATHNTAAGALIGGAVGAGAGALAGHSVDDSEKKQEQAQIAAAQAAQAKMLGLSDIAGMAQQHISDQIIINQIQATHSVYNLSANDITWLKGSGVSDQVILVMQQTANQPVVVAPPPRRYYSAQPVVVVEQPPPPPPPVGFAVGVRVH